MEFNPEELTLKEVNANAYNETWDLVQKNLNVPEKCMEINCAFGYTTKHFILPVLHPKSTIIGTDSSETMIKYATKKYEDNKRLTFEVFDIQTKDLPEKYIAGFDRIFSYPTLHSRNDIQREFDNVYKMLKSGGSFHLSMVTLHDAFRLYHRMKKHPIYGSYFKKYTSPFEDPLLDPLVGVEELLQRTGFSVEYCVSATAQHDVDYLLPYIFYGLPFIREMTPKEQKDIRNELTYQFDKMEKTIHRCFMGNDPRYNPNIYNIDRYSIVEVHAFKPITTI